MRRSSLATALLLLVQTDASCLTWSCSFSGYGASQSVTSGGITYSYCCSGKMCSAASDCPARCPAPARRLTFAPRRALLHDPVTLLALAAPDRPSLLRAPSLLPRCRHPPRLAAFLVGSARALRAAREQRAAQGARQRNQFQSGPACAPPPPPLWPRRRGSS